MKKIIFTSLISIITLSSCSFGNISSNEKNENWSGSPLVISTAKVENGKLVTLNYTLREWAKDGKILETTAESIAKENNIYSSTGRYETFQVMIGWNGVIPWFEKGLIGMGKWEKKIIEVTPDVGYGTGPTLQTIRKQQLAPVFTIVQDKKIFEPKIKQTVDKESMREDMRNAKVWETLTGANGEVAKVIASDNNSLTLEIENKANPFYGKKIVVGATAETLDGSASFKITKIVGTGVTLEVTNRQSPFYNKKFEPGASITTPQGKITIRSFSGDTIDIAQEHPLMGKTLYFDVEIVDIQ